MLSKKLRRSSVIYKEQTAHLVQIYLVQKRYLPVLPFLPYIIRALILSQTISKRGIEYILNKQNKDGYWDFLYQSKEEHGNIVNWATLSTVLVLETLDLINEDTHNPIWATRKKRKPHKEYTRIQHVSGFKTPQGTSWEEVKIEFLTEQTVRISVGDYAEGMDFQDMGFCDRRKRPKEKTPDIIWETLFEFAKHQGELSYHDEIRPKIARNLKANVHVISKRLQDFFGISGSPFKQFNRKTKSWTTKFTIIDAIQD